MTDLRDLSKLPADSAYWEDLEARITGELGASVRSRAASEAWLAPLSARAWELGGLALAAGLAALLLLPQRAPHGPGHSGFLGVRPDAAAMAVLVSSPAPPPVSALILPTPASER